MLLKGARASELFRVFFDAYCCDRPFTSQLSNHNRFSLMKQVPYQGEPKWVRVNWVRKD
jgi:hypothetical protein